MKTKEKIEVFDPSSLLTTVGEELVDILEANNLSKEQFLKDIELAPNIEEITYINKDKLKEIEKFLNIDSLACYLGEFQKKYISDKKEAKTSYQKYKKIYSKLKNLIPLTTTNYNLSIDQLGDFYDFLGIENEEDIFIVSDEKINALYRKKTSQAQQIDNLSLFVWKRRGEELFKQKDLPEYNESLLREWIDNKEWEYFVENVDYFKNLPDIFKEFGIGLILEPYLKKTVYGLVNWINNRPLIQISDREKKLPVCWYTLFHEIGHVLLHKNKQIFEFDDLSKSITSKIEKEANKFASSLLFSNGDIQRKIFSLNKINKERPNEDIINNMAEEFNVKPMFVAYWYDKAGLGNKDVNNKMPKISFG